MKRRPKAFRTAVLLLLLLAGGAIVNVAVAWGCSWWAKPVVVDVSGMSRQGLRLFRLMHPDETQSCEVIVVAQSFGFEERSTIRWMIPTSGMHPAWHSEFFLDATERIRQGAVAMSSEMHPGMNPSPPAMMVETGWPAPGVRGWGDPLFRGYVANRTVGRLHAIAFEQDSHMTRLLPYLPIWPGFAINTVFYAVIMWLLFAAPFALRRLRGGRRIKRGLCPKCAYDLRAAPADSTACPECGTLAKSRVVPS